MRRYGFTLVEKIVTLCISGILFAILAPVFQRRAPAFTTTSIPPVRYHNQELHSVMDDLFRTIQQQRGTKVNYARHFQWENDDIKTRNVWLETDANLPLSDIFQRLENVAQIKIDRVERPYHSGDVGKYVIRDAKSVSKP